jgi:hypothetical protein
MRALHDRIDRLTAMDWVDAAGLEWQIIDWRMEALREVRTRVPLGDPSADGRLFVPQGRDGPPRLYLFNRSSYHDTADRVLRDQLRFARPFSGELPRRGLGV